MRRLKEASDVGGEVERWRVGSGIDRMGRSSCARLGEHRSAMSSSVRISCWPIIILWHSRGVLGAVDGGDHLAGGYCSRGVYLWAGYGGCGLRLNRAPSIDHLLKSVGIYDNRLTL